MAGMRYTGALGGEVPGRLARGWAGLLLACALTAAYARDDGPPAPADENENRWDEASETCTAHQLADQQWVDRMRSGLSAAACASSAWFDGFFGTTRSYDAYRATYGTISAGTLWDERNGFDPRLRFRVRLQLPQADRRLNAFVGRVDQDDYVSGREDEFETLPRQFGQEDDDALLLGLGWGAANRQGSWFDADAGVKVSLPLDPYVRGSWNLVKPMSQSTLLRLRESVFWRNTQRAGVTSRTDLDHVINPGWLARMTAVGTYSEVTLGIDWYSTATLFQSVDERRAFAYRASVSGETDRPVTVKDYGFQVIYRQRITREWLFLELRSSITWPKDLPEESRDSNWGLGVALEMQFGDRLRARQRNRREQGPVESDGG
jgi:hypothetical protein